MSSRKPLRYYLGLNYPFRAQIDPDDGSFFVDFPDLPSCWTGADRLEELPAMIKEATTAWIEVAYGDGHPISEPTVLDMDEPSGKFNLRVPKALHRTLGENAGREGVSLNQYVVALLARGDVQARIEQRLNDLEAALLGAKAGSSKVAEEKAIYSASPRRKVSSRKATPKTTRGRSTKR
jgi:antitoxin HicB